MYTLTNHLKHQLSSLRGYISLVAQLCILQPANHLEKKKNYERRGFIQPYLVTFNQRIPLGS